MAAPKKDIHVTNLAALEKAKNGEIVELPGWTDETPFVARLRRASLSAMLKAGKIPNPLIPAAQRLYEGAASRANPKFDEVAKVMHMVAEDALIEPTAQQIEAAGLTLTEPQVDDIYCYAIRGAAALAGFRAKRAGAQSGADGQAMQPASQPADGD